MLIDRFHRALVRIVREAAPSEILDVGCGEGYVLGALRAGGVRCPMHGIDLSEDAIAEARVRVSDATFEATDALALAESGRRYDLVLMTEVLEHLPDPTRMLGVLERIARRYTVTSVPWEPFFRGLNFLRGKHVLAFGNDPEHVNHWGHGEFVRLVGQRFSVYRTPMVFPWTLVASRRRADRPLS